ncbi:MAG: CDP-alcohol phosphatidyltransferase family protein [Clostridia bacterium]|nr:CDP-alcohol phosphatidyltransferase family protein [Clostridia bacterium]MBQ7122148.1 CDP-alcohol phosphatidyltransferase family protein [Clostridia bacterium]
MKALIKEYLTGCLTIPNLLSVIRIALIPVFAVLFNNGDYLWAVIVLAISGLTDFFDGKIARKFNQISALGKLLDPIADKLSQMTIAVMFYLTFSGSSDETVKTFSWIFLVFIIKEAVMVVGGAIMIAFGLKPVAAELPGKLATFAFYTIMCIVMAFGPDIGILREALFTLPATVMLILVGISVILTVIAFLSYMPGVFRQVKEKKNSK